MRYGKTIDNPVKLRSIKASLAFLSNLVTESGKFILFHRLFSTPSEKGPIDCYEILSSDYKKDKIYIDIYNSKNEMIPPDGYLFDNEEISFEEIDYSNENIYIDTYKIDNQYVIGNKDTEISLNKHHSESTRLEEFIENSYGVNYKVGDFPKDLVNHVVENNIFYFLKPNKKIIDKIMKEYSKVN